MVGLKTDIVRKNACQMWTRGRGSKIFRTSFRSSYKFQDRGVDRQVSKESKEEARVEKKKAEKAAAVNKFLTEKGDAREKVTLSEMISKKQEGKASDKKASRRKDKD